MHLKVKNLIHKLEFKNINKMEKTLDNTTASQAKDKVKDIQFWGDGDTMKLLCKASSKSEKFMKSTKAMEIEGVGCVVQVTTQQGDNIAEAVTYVPNVKIEENKNDKGEVIGRKLVAINSAFKISTNI